MKKVKATILILSALLFANSLEVFGQKVADYNVVPLPQNIEISNGDPFRFDKNTVIYCFSESLMNEAQFLQSYIKEITGLNLKINNKKGVKSAIILKSTLKDENKEAYKITISADEIVINGASSAGVFYGIQTLRKSLPIGETIVNLPQGEIYDYPNFDYRGMMLDISRHFYNVDEVKTYIDMLALHNINNFHWHITDDQGWRIEIKKYPKLATISSQRAETVIGRLPGKWDGKPHGGIFTQDQAKEIVEYARKRHINVIPEIDMPGHMRAALAAYPEMGCTGGPYDVWTEWGVSDEVLCAGNDKTLQFITDVLNEIMDIFPSTYIHAGGDECPKVRWKECPKCQARIKEEGIKGDDKLTAEQYLQSYVMQHANKVIANRGRVMIGWDEVLEGSIGQEVVVMSWRGNAGGIEGAKKGHNVIMVPNTHMYFDFYQSKDIQFEPFAIGGYISVEKVYNFEPIPKELNSEEAKFIKGLQANLWTEYILDFPQVQYMVLPRMAALSEVQWRKTGNKDYELFKERMPKLFDLYHKLNYNYAKHLLDVAAVYEPNSAKESLEINLSTLKGGEIFYTLDGSNPTSKSQKYTTPIEVKNDAIFKASVIRNGESGRIICDTIHTSKSSFKNIRLLQPPHESYTFSGAPTLVDGITGTGNYRTGRWLGFTGNNLEAIIDLNRVTELSNLSFNCCLFQCDGVVDAKGVQIYSSEDGTNFTLVTKVDFPEIVKEEEFGVKNHSVSFAPINTKFVKVVIESQPSLPSWHPLTGAAGFLFVDEIELN